MQLQSFVSDVGAGLLGSVVGVKVMEPVTVKVQELMSEEDRSREKRVSPGSPYALAVERLSSGLGLTVNDDQKKQASAVLPYVAGLSAAPAYWFLRRTVGVGPWLSGLGAAMVLFLGLDEALLPPLGLSAPARAYPKATHLRGLLGHLAFGLTLAATAALIERLAGRRATT